MTYSAILQLDNVTCQFARSAIPAVDRVSLDLAEGELLALLGPSGCGKTTLLRLVAGLETPQHGGIRLAGQLVSGQGHWLPPERRDVGIVFQDYALFPHLTVAENIAFGLQSQSQRAKPAGIIADRVSETIALVGLTGLERRYPHQLSGGQQQRVALARALAPQPALILLDEPLSNLDVQVRLHLRREVRDILKATGTSAIFVTHDQEEALAIADQVAVMRRGQIKQRATPEQLYHQPDSRFVAEFVTQANFIPAQRQGGFWQTEIGKFPVQSSRWDAMAMDDRLVDRASAEIMIRQEDLALVAQVEGALWVRDRQFLGREYCYQLQTASGQTLQARTPITVEVAVGDRVNVIVADHASRVFPVSSEEAIAFSSDRTSSQNPSTSAASVI